MRPHALVFAAATAAGALSPTIARGGGFEIDGQSATSTAMAGALTALAPDASSIFHNAAGIVMRRGGDALLGAGYRLELMQVTTEGGVYTGATADSLLMPTVFVSQHAHERVALGVGVFSQFAMQHAWDPTGLRGADAVPFPGRFLGTSTELQTLNVNPTIAVKAMDWLAVGAGLDVVIGSMTHRRGLRLGDVETSTTFGGESRGVGWNVGVLAVVLPGRLSAGLHYRSGVKLDFAGTSYFRSPPELSRQLGNREAHAEIPLPHTISLGLAVHPARGLTISADVRATLWSDFAELRIRYADGQPADYVLSQKWRDSVTTRLGLEYLVGKTTLALRLGFGWDQSPVPSETMGPFAPGASRFLVGGGFGYTLRTSALKGFGLGVGYLASVAGLRPSSLPELPAAYFQSAHQFNVSLSYHWGGGIGAGVGAGTGCGPTACKDCQRCAAAPSSGL